MFRQLTALTSEPRDAAYGDCRLAEAYDRYERGLRRLSAGQPLEGEGSDCEGRPSASVRRRLRIGPVEVGRPALHRISCRCAVKNRYAHLVNLCPMTRSGLTRVPESMIGRIDVPPRRTNTRLVHVSGFEPPTSSMAVLDECFDAWIVRRRLCWCSAVPRGRRNESRP